DASLGVGPMIDASDPRPDMAQFHAREALLKAFRPLSISCPPEVVSLVQTCQCHPSQWEGWTSNGSAIYVRFRHGRLWVGSHRTTGALRQHAVRRPVARGRR